jgi:hypothetical protein
MRLSTILSALIAVTVLAGGPASALAQTADPPNPLKTVKAMKCRFPVAVSGTWKNGEAVATPRTQELLLSIGDIDVGDGTAEVTGTAGKAFVSAVLSGWSLYFVENAVGQLNVTTVFAQETAPGKLKAVHSRHGYLQMTVGKFISEPSVSQNYGECEIAS